MNLKVLYTQLNDLVRIRDEKNSECIEYGCQKLLDQLNIFMEFHKDDFTVVDTGLGDKNIWINLRYLCHIGIRYCGYFVNTILINKDVTRKAQDRITLTFASYEDDESFMYCDNYNHDEYYGEKGDSIEDIPIMNDWDNFINLIESLKPFFTNINDQAEEDYRLMCKDIRDYHKQLFKDINNRIDILGEDIEDYFNRVFESSILYDKKCRKHFIMLPNNLSLRYKGRFHNCIVRDDYSISLGFIKQQNFIGEEGYRQDYYTVENDFNRYEEKEFLLVHESSLNFYNEGFYQLKSVLRELIFIYGKEDIRSKDLKYIHSRKVSFKHTILTD